MVVLSVLKVGKPLGTGGLWLIIGQAKDERGHGPTK